MKKIIAILLTTVLMLSCFSMAVSAKVGDVIGQALHTDIVAYINNYAIPSYAVNGQSVIVAEDLRNFGFDVAWDEYTRSLTVTRNNDAWVNSMDFKKSAEFGKKFTNILQTDIKVYAGDKQITSYAMNGYTMIPIEELTMFGEVYWVAEQRAIKLWVDALSIRPTMQEIEIEYPITAKTYSFWLAACGGDDDTWDKFDMLTVESIYSYQTHDEVVYAKAPATFTTLSCYQTNIYKFENIVTDEEFVEKYWDSLPIPYATYNTLPTTTFTLPKGNYIFELHTGGWSFPVQVIVE